MCAPRFNRDTRYGLPVPPATHFCSGEAWGETKIRIQRLIAEPAQPSAWCYSVVGLLLACAFHSWVMMQEG